MRATASRFFLAAAVLAAAPPPVHAQSEETATTLCGVEAPADEVPAPGARTETVGFVKRAEGSVFVLRAARATVRELAAEVGMDLRAHDAVRSGPDGAFDIIFTDNTTVSGVSDSCLEISEYVYGEADANSEMRLRLGRGVISISAGEIARIRDDAMSVKVRDDTNLAVTGTRIVVRAK